MLFCRLCLVVLVVLLLCLRVVFLFVCPFVYFRFGCFVGVACLLAQLFGFGFMVVCLLVGLLCVPLNNVYIEGSSIMLLKNGYVVYQTPNRWLVCVFVSVFGGDCLCLCFGVFVYVITCLFACLCVLVCLFVWLLVRVCMCLFICCLVCVRVFASLRFSMRI